MQIQDPVPIEEKWNEILNATEEKMYCMQKNYLLPNPTVSGVEDCLYLYVYRPKVRQIPKNKILSLDDDSGRPKTSPRDVYWFLFPAFELVKIYFRFAFVRLHFGSNMRRRQKCRKID